MSGCGPSTGTTATVDGQWRPSTTPWHEPPVAPALKAHDVHVWRAPLDDPGWPIDQLADSLSPDEHDRASAFAAARDRRRFLIRRGVLRRLLAGYVGRSPRALPLTAGPNDKPVLAASPASALVSFNSSSSGQLALYAFSRQRRVGVDVEAVRVLPEAETIAELCLSARERAELATLPRCARDRALLRWWSMKEAYVKAVGEGLTRPLGGIEVSVPLAAPSTLRAIDGQPAAASRWTSRELSPAVGYVGALVVEGRVHALSCWAIPTSTSTS